MRAITDMRGKELGVERSAGGYELTLRATLSSTRQLDRANVRELLDVIAGSPVLRAEMRNALSLYECTCPPRRTRSTWPAIPGHVADCPQRA